MGATSTISDNISEKFTGNASTRSSNITFSHISEITYLHFGESLQNTFGLSPRSNSYAITDLLFSSKLEENSRFLTRF